MPRPMTCIPNTSDESVDRGRGFDPALFRWSRRLLLAILFLAPLAFGSVEPWAWGAIILLTTAPFLLWVAGSMRNGTVVVVWSWLYLPAIALLGVATIQLIFHLSLDPAGTSEALLKLAWCMLIFFLIVQLYYVAPHHVWSQLGLSVLLYSSLLGIFAIVQFFAMPGLIYGIVPSPNVNFGPYVNRDHFAGLYEMLVPIAAAYYLASGRKSQFSLLWAFGLLIAIVALLFTGSRGGLLALIAEVVLFVLVIVLRTRSGLRASLVWGAGGLLIAAIAFLLFIGPAWLPARMATIFRVADPAVAGERPQVTRDTMRIFHDHLAMGTGLGTFEAVYPQYQSFMSDKSWPYAHNDYAQLLAETGIIGGLSAAFALWFFVYEGFWTSRRVPLLTTHAWIQLGAFLGCCGILAHSFVDFNLHIPANAAWFSACVGLAVTRQPPATRSAADADAS